MEDLLDLYAEPHDPKRPVVCFDESPIQLIGEVRVPITPKPGKRYRYDCEYKRNGTANLFVMIDANRSWRKVKVIDRRTSQDFAVCRRELVDADYPEVDKFRVVMDKPVNPHCQRHLPNLPRRRSASDLAASGVPLHAQTR